MGKTLAFEQPIVKLREKIRELEQFTKESEVDLSEEIYSDRLEYIYNNQHRLTSVMKMSNINCSESGCVYQVDGKCSLNQIKNARVSDNPNCIYFTPADLKNPEQNR